jgi:hypothetical protein
MISENEGVEMNVIKNEKSGKMIKKINGKRFLNAIMEKTESTKKRIMKRIDLFREYRTLGTGIIFIIFIISP